jgi:hypothetical protein
MHFSSKRGAVDLPNFPKKNWEADNATERIFEHPRLRPDQLSVLKVVTFV